MSLISDALKKARQEAAIQDSRRQSLPYAVGSADAPKRNALIPVLAGLGAGCLLAAVLFGVAYLAGWGPFGKPEPAQVAQAAPAPTTADAPAPVIEEQAPAQTPVPVLTPPPAPTPEPVLAQPVPVGPEPTPAPPAAVAPPEETRPAPVPTPSPVAPAPPAGAPEEPRSYIREVPVPGGGTVTLNGIAYSPDRPIAVLDGRVVGPGEGVQGFTIVEIQPDRVKMEGHGTVVYVSLK